MANRTKAYPSHRDSWTYSQEYGHAEIMHEAVLEGGQPSVVKAWEGLKPFQKWPKFYRKHRPNFNDPMVVYYVLDVMIESASHTYIRPSYLTPYLNNTAPMFFWDTGTIGRVLAGVWEAAVETYLDSVDEGGMEYIASHDGEGRPIELHKRMRQIPLSLGRDARGKYYIIDPENGSEGRMWLVKFRHVMAKLAFEAMKDESEGTLGGHMGKERAAPLYLVPLSPEPTMSAQLHRSQLRPGLETRPRARQVDVLEFGEEEDDPS